MNETRENSKNAGPAQRDAAAPTSSWWQRNVTDKGFLPTVYSVGFGVFLAAQGLLFRYPDVPGSLITTFYIIALITLFTLQMQYARSKSQLETEQYERAHKVYQKKLQDEEAKRREAEAEMEKNWAGKEFLSKRIGNNLEMIESLIGANSEKLKEISSNELKKVRIINETLSDLCNNLQAVASKHTDTLFSEAWFHATYMEIQSCRVSTDDQGQPLYTPIDREKDTNDKDNGQLVPRLVYVAWHTQNGLQPASMSLKRTLGEDQGIAGQAWRFRRAVVVPDPEHDDRWKQHYPGQKQSYKSMVCVPVVRGDQGGRLHVIGVVTVDTYINGYFGSADTRPDQDRAASVVIPYANYIALISTIDRRVHECIQGDSVSGKGNRSKPSRL